MSKIPELKEILGAMVFAAKRPVTIREMRSCLEGVAQSHGAETAVFAEAKNAEVRDALAELSRLLADTRCGFAIAEVAGGYRLQSDPACGRWLRHMLAIDKPQRLSRPALETLAIIAYRQPVARSEIEGVRGVAVGHMVKALMEMQLVKIVGRSDLPGRPLLYGTTHTFLEHFGLKDLKELSQIDASLLPRGETRPSRKAAPAGGDAAAVAAPAQEDNAGHLEEEAVLALSAETAPAEDDLLDDDLPEGEAESVFENTDEEGDENEAYPEEPEEPEEDDEDEEEEEYEDDEDDEDEDNEEDEEDV